jgi:soluble lytic murein transglycosylase-like protein
LIRQESRFNPNAQSRSGATGLMQLMPATATFVSGKKDFRSREGQYSLMEPQLNIDIGQRYVEKLMYQDHVETELFSLIIAYNAGPGNLRKWKRALRHMHSDPLLFVEMVPMRETRAFVERVMANYWIYRLRMGQTTPSLDAVAEGRWARYVALDGLRRADAPQNNNFRYAQNSRYN